MKSESFNCPHCGVHLTKSAAAQVLGEAHSYMILGGMPASTPCPACGGGIDTKAMIDGKYDPDAGGCGSVVGFVGLVIFLIWLFA